MPRSPSRDLSDRFIGHRRYFRNWSLLEKWKMWLSFAAVLGLVGWATASLLMKSSTQIQLTHGPLANPHAAWDANCEVCHRDVKGISLDAQGKWNSFTCEKCHAAPAHNSKISNDESSANCASCHHDHNGRNYSLVSMTDNHCTRCHQNLVDSQFHSPIKSFTNDDHPEFKPLIKPRPSTIKFSHAQHMTAGIVLTKGATNAWTLDKIPETEREKYRLPGQANNAAVQLDCKSCHSLEGTAKADGKYFAPVNFDQSCKACHSLSTPSLPTQNKLVVEPISLPHGQQFGEISKWIEAAVALKVQSEHKPLFSTPNPFDPKKKDDPAVKAYLDDVKQTAAKATEFLSISCKKCHEMDGNQTKKSAIPAVWMTHASFNHASHKATTCTSCHPKTAARFVDDVTNYEREPVNILGVKSCQECHGPKQNQSRGPNGETHTTGGVRFGCTDCHRFHGGDQPLHGRGSSIRTPKDALTWQEFLNGKLEPGRSQREVE